MRNRIYAILAAVLLLPVSLTAQDVMERFSVDVRRNAEVKSISSDFTQTRCVSVLESEVSKSGRFTFQTPSDLKLDFSDGDFIHMSGDDFEIRSEGRTNSVKVGSNPMLKELRRVLSSCMSGDVESILAGFDAVISETPKTYTLSLSPRNRRAGSMMKSLQMEFSKTDMSLTWMKMVEPGDDWTKYSFTNKKISR